MASPEIGPDGLPFWVKDPQAVKDYQILWTDWLAGDTITNSQWFVEAGITQGATGSTGTTALIWLSGGVHGKDYTVTNRITTVGGRTEERSFVIRVRNQ